MCTLKQVFPLGQEEGMRKARLRHGKPRAGSQEARHRPWEVHLYFGYIWTIIVCSRVWFSSCLRFSPGNLGAGRGVAVLSHTEELHT